MVPNGMLTALLVGIFLLIVVLLAITAGNRTPDSPAGRYTQVFSVGVAYAVPVISVFTNGGMDLAGWIILLVALVIAIVFGLWSVIAFHNTNSELFRTVGVISGFLIICVQLVAVGNVVALIGGLSPRWVTIAIGLTVGLYVISRGWRAAGRTSRWSWAFPILAALVLLAGLFLGKVATLGTPVLPVQELPFGAVMGVFVAMAVLGSMDLVLRRTLQSSPDHTRIAFGGGAILLGTVTAFAIGLMLVLGGSLFAPNEPIMTIVSTLAPTGQAIISGLLVAWFASIVDSYVAASSDAIAETAPKELTESRRQGAVVAIVIAAIVVSVFVPPVTYLFVLAAMVAAAGLGCLLAAATRTGFSTLALAVGIIAAGVVAAMAGFDQTMNIGPWTAVALLVGVLAAYLTAVAQGRLDSGSDADRSESLDQQV